jgi:general stress protein YciG
MAKGFTGNPERARELGRIGGKKSRREWTDEERKRHSKVMRARYKGGKKSVST